MNFEVALPSDRRVSTKDPVYPDATDYQFYVYRYVTLVKWL